MNQIEIMQSVAGLHNILSEISVRGEDAIRMRDVLIGMRNLTMALANNANADHECQRGGEANGELLT